MNGLMRILLGDDLRFMAREMDAVDRYHAMREGATNVGFSVWIWYVFAMMAASAAVVAVILLVRNRKRTQLAMARFNQRVEERGFTNAQQKVLLAAARAIKLPEPASVFTSESSFELGINRLLQSSQVIAMSDEERAGIDGIAESIREKLGFGGFDQVDLSEDDQPDSQTAPAEAAESQWRTDEVAKAPTERNSQDTEKL